MTEGKVALLPEPPIEPMAWASFLEGHPPGSSAIINDAYVSSSYTNHAINIPKLKLFCSSDTCNGHMFFSTEDRFFFDEFNKWQNQFLTYFCRNCRSNAKSFALAIKLLPNSTAIAFKFGEFPNFGPPIPPRTIRLIQSDKDLFMRGRRCENQGLGIGAFAYYRRVVENQWTRLVENIIKVGRSIGAPEATISALEAAKREQQFSKAVSGLKDAIPQALLINGQNPLILLHAALSQGVHNLPDAECLELATSIRIILVELAEKLGEALKDEKELASAVKKLLSYKNAK